MIGKFFKRIFGKQCKDDGGSQRCVEAAQTADEEDEKSNACASLEPYLLSMIDSMNRHENIKPLFHDRAEVLFKEAPMTLDGWLEEWKRLFLSFPDFHVDYSEVKQIDSEHISVVFKVMGTHTGEPYCFGPYPEIEATGIEVKLDPE